MQPLVETLELVEVGYPPIVDILWFLSVLLYKSLYKILAFLTNTKSGGTRLQQLTRNDEVDQKYSIVTTFFVPFDVGPWKRVRAPLRPP